MRVETMTDADDAAAIRQRQNAIAEEMASLEFYKSQNEEALRRALAKDKAIRHQSKYTNKDTTRVSPPAREREGGWWGPHFPSARWGEGRVRMGCV